MCLHDDNEPLAGLSGGQLSCWLWLGCQATTPCWDTSQALCRVSPCPHSTQSFPHTSGNELLHPHVKSGESETLTSPPWLPPSFHPLRVPCSGTQPRAPSLSQEPANEHALIKQLSGLVPQLLQKLKFPRQEPFGELQRSRDGKFCDSNCRMPHLVVFNLQIQQPSVFITQKAPKPKKMLWLFRCCSTCRFLVLPKLLWLGAGQDGAEPCGL